jgi:hypothetical protein
VLGSTVHGFGENPGDMEGQYFGFYDGYLVSLSNEPPSTAYYRTPVSYANYPGSPSAHDYPPSGSPRGHDTLSSPPAVYGAPPNAFAGAIKTGPIGSTAVPTPPTYNNVYFPNAPQHLPGFRRSPDSIPLELTEPFAVYGKL